MAQPQICDEIGVQYDVSRIRGDFPILSEEIHGRPLAFLDNGASAQKPRQVIDAVRAIYETEYANVHRGAYYLSEQATARYEGARDIVQHFLNASNHIKSCFWYIVIFPFH